MSNLILTKKIYNNDCKTMNGFILIVFFTMNIIIFGYSLYFNQIILIMFSSLCLFTLLFLISVIMKVECYIYFCESCQINKYDGYEEV